MGDKDLRCPRCLHLAALAFIGGDKRKWDFIGIKGHYWQEVKSQAFCDLFVMLFGKNTILLFSSLYRIDFNTFRSRVLGAT